jgi:hypothetical protein
MSKAVTWPPACVPPVLLHRIEGSNAVRVKYEESMSKV